MRQIVLVASLVLIGSGLALAGSNVRYVTPPEPGVIYTVVNYNRQADLAQLTTVTLRKGNTRQQFTVSPPYRRCVETSPSGFVLKLRHQGADPLLVVIRTSGEVIRGPYQGDPPLEQLHPCYKLVLR